MGASIPEQVTQALAELSAGEAQAASDLLPLVYDDLRALAERCLQQERGDHTLQPTALVHEAFLRLVGRDDSRWESQAHFYRVAARAMRRILVNHARDRGRVKRGGDRERVAFDEVEIRQREQPSCGAAAAEAGEDLVALDDALTRLATLDERKVQIVELRYFTGFSIEESARILDISTAQLKRDWTLAKAWLMRELQRGHEA